MSPYLWGAICSTEAVSRRQPAFLRPTLGHSQWSGRRQLRERPLVSRFGNVHPFWPQRYRFNTTLSAEECANRLGDAIGSSPESALSANPSYYSTNLDEPMLRIPKFSSPRQVSSRWPLIGWATARRFQISTQPSSYLRNLPQQSFAKTWALGSLAPRPNGTEVSVTFWVLPSVYLGWALLGLVPALAIEALTVGLRLSHVALALDLVVWLIAGALAFPILLVLPFLCGRLLAWDEGPRLLRILGVLLPPVQAERPSTEERAGHP